MIVTRILLQTHKDDNNRTLEVKDLTVGENLKILKHLQNLRIRQQAGHRVFFSKFCSNFK